MEQDELLPEPEPEATGRAGDDGPADPGPAVPDRAGLPRGARWRPERGAAPDTGDPRVDEAVAVLDQLGGLPVAGHPAVFRQVHGQLVEVLGELDAVPAPGAEGTQGN